MLPCQSWKKYRAEVAERSINLSEIFQLSRTLFDFGSKVLQNLGQACPNLSFIQNNITLLF